MTQSTAKIEHAEIRTLLSYLNAQRQHVLGILEGIEEEDLRRQILPSGWTCLGLIRHLTLDVEQFWFRGIVAGDQDVIDRLAAGHESSWIVGGDIPASDVFDAYRRQIERANAILTIASPDATLAWWPEGLFGDWRLDTVREVILHVFTETACHAGHLDAAREIIDGRQWMVLDVLD